MSTNEERIWNYLIGKGLSKAGAAGLMGNLFAESGLSPKNLQNTYEKKLGFTDDSYTAAVTAVRIRTSSVTAQDMASRSGRFGAENRICLTSHEPQESPLETWKCSSIFFFRSCQAATSRFCPR